jgi:hypothetical protein
MKFKFEGTTLKLALDSHKRPSCYMAFQYLQELISIYKGTPVKLLMKKSDFSAVELRL